MPSEDGERALKPGDWNELLVSAYGKPIVTTLNGVKTVDFTDPSPRFTEGVSGFQTHTGGGGKVRWKDLYDRETNGPKRMQKRQ